MRKLSRQLIILIQRNKTMIPFDFTNLNASTRTWQLIQCDRLLIHFRYVIHIEHTTVARHSSDHFTTQTGNFFFLLTTRRHNRKRHNAHQPSSTRTQTSTSHPAQLSSPTSSLDFISDATTSQPRNFYLSYSRHLTKLPLKFGPTSPVNVYPYGVQATCVFGGGPGCFRFGTLEFIYIVVSSQFGTNDHHLAQLSAFRQ